MKNNISYKSAMISGIIGLVIGLIFTYIFNYSTPIEQIKQLYIAIGIASFCAGFGGNLSGQQEVLNRNN